MPTDQLLGKNSKIRFQIREKSKAYSDSWSVARNGSDIYLTASGIGWACKISLHESGVCRFAINETLASHNPPLPSSDRAIVKWRVDEDPITEHSHSVRLLFIPFTRGVSSGHESNAKAIHLPFPPKGGMVEVSGFYSRTNPLDWESKRWPTKNILGVWKLCCENYICFRRRVAPISEVEFDNMLSIVQNSSTDMFVGEENPDIVSTGYYDALGSLAYDHLGIIFTFLAVPIFSTDKAVTWSTKTGNRRLGK